MMNGGCACLVDMFLVWLYAVVIVAQALAESGGVGCAMKNRCAYKKHVFKWVYAD